MNVVAQQKSSTGNFFSRLWNGDIGLAKTYWIFGQAAGFIWGLALSALQLSPGSAVAKIFLSLMAAYFIFVFIGIWRASNKYQGNKSWARLAKLSVVLGAIVTVVPVVLGLFKSAVS